MADPGMKPLSPAQTTAGGGSVEQQEVQLGPVTYEIQRVYQGDRPIQELVMARLEHANLAFPAFDGDTKDTV